MVKIGSVEIGTNIFLSPMSGCSDFSFRLICREQGAKLCFFEMIDANSLYYKRRVNLDILKTSEKDNPIAAQLVGSDPAIMLLAANKLLGLIKPLFLDINCACPAKKITKKKAGSYLLHDTKRMSEIIKSLSSSLPIPVTVKLRLGFHENDPNHIEKIAALCESSGAAALFVHGRTRQQGYSGNVNYQAIKLVKKTVDIPVFGSGDILTPELAKKMLDMTGVDGICVARGALGNPWIFNHIENYVKCGKSPKEVLTIERKKVLKRHLRYIAKYKDMPPLSKVGYMHKVSFWYLKNFHNAARIRERLSGIKSYEGLVNEIDKLDLSSP